MGRIHSIETLGALDGPGIRTVVFFQGCPMRCMYCHNADTWALDGGTELTASDIVRKIQRYKPYYKNDGGVTISGGEPLVQAKFAMEILKGCKDIGVHTALDTSGCVFNEDVVELLEYVDLILLDVKHADRAEFERLTSHSMEQFLKFIKYCEETQKQMWIRQVIVPGITDSITSIRALKQLVANCNVDKIELLPYHTHGVYKWERLGYTYPLEGVAVPSNSVMQALNNEVNHGLF